MLYSYPREILENMRRSLDRQEKFIWKLVDEGLCERESALIDYIEHLRGHISELNTWIDVTSKGETFGP